MSNKQLHFSADHRDRYEFLPAGLEVLETPPVPFGRIIAITISIFFMLAVLWASLGTIDVVVVSQGKIIPAGKIKIIQPLETGVVRVIHVSDGDSVKQGDLLLELVNSQPLFSELRLLDLISDDDGMSAQLRVRISLL